MINVSDSIKEAFLDRDKINLKLTFSDGTVLTNSDFVSGTFSLEQTLCEEEQLVFGSVGSACMSIQVLKTGKKYKGLTVSAVIYTDTDGIPLGTFTITDDTLSDDRSFRSLQGYDAVYIHSNDDLQAWYDSLTFPISVKNFRDSLFTHVGITQETTTLVNDNIMLDRTIDPTEQALTFNTCIKAICEINGVLGCMTQENKFRYVRIDFLNGALLPSETLYPSDDLFPEVPPVDEEVSMGDGQSIIKQGSYVYKDFNVPVISRVNIKEKDSDYGTFYGNGDNLYTIVGNFLLYGNTSDENMAVARNFYGVASGVTYIPTRATTLGMPWIELGDIIGLQGNHYSIFPVLHRTMTGIANCEDTYEANGTEEYTLVKYGSNADVRQAKQRTLELKAEIGLVESKMTERIDAVDSELTSRITQTVGMIETEVTERQGADAAMSTRITQTSNAITSEVNARQNADASLSSRIEQAAHSIILTVGTSSGKSTGLTITVLDENGNVIDSDSGTITLSGEVIMKSNLTDGVTKISGSNIETNSITADKINTNGLVAETVEANAEIKTPNIKGVQKITFDTNNNYYISSGGTGYLDRIYATSLCAHTLYGRAALPDSEVVIGLAKFVRVPTYNGLAFIYNKASYGNVITTMAKSYGNGTDYFEITAGGTAYGVTAWASDRKLKDNIEDSDENGLEKILAIKHRQFDWKRNDDHVKLGYVAQELEEIDEAFVFDVGDTKQVSEIGLIPAITKSIQELYEIIETQQKQINSMQREINELKERINE